MGSVDLRRILDRSGRSRYSTGHLIPSPPRRRTRGGGFVAFTSRNLAATVLASLVLTVGPASAQGLGVGASLDVERITPQKLGTQTIYMAKLLCGTIPPSPTNPQAPAGALLAPGTYLSRINIHYVALKDPQIFDIYVSAGGLQQVSSRTLQPFGTATIDCGTVISPFDPLDPFVERSIAITAVFKPKSLGNVVGVYTFKNVDQAR
jgi:hypothetical protein